MRDFTLRLWDVTTRTQLTDPLVGHDGAVTAAAFAQAPEGRLILASAGGRSVRLWELTNSGATGHSLHYDADEWFTGVGFARGADGRLLLAASSAQGRVRLWDVGSGMQVRLLGGFPLGPFDLTDLVPGGDRWYVVASSGLVALDLTGLVDRAVLGGGDAVQSDLQRS